MHRALPGPAEIFTSGEVRFAVDTYGLGIVLFYMVQGHGPFTGLAPFQVGAASCLSRGMDGAT